MTLSANKALQKNITLAMKMMLIFIVGGPFAVNAQAVVNKSDTLNSKPFVDWAKVHAISLQDPDKATNYKDLQPVKQIIGKARVVAMGEPAHGLHEPQAFRNRLFKYLAEQCGFTTIVLEAGLAESELANTYVLTGVGSPEVAAKALTIGNASPENIELMKWMRVYNVNPRHNNKIKFLGMDVELVGYPGDTTSRHTAINGVLGYLNKVDPQSRAKITAALLPYINRLSAAGYTALSAEEHDRLSIILDDIIALVERQHVTYVAKSSIAEYEWVHRLAIAARQTDQIVRLTPPDVHGEIPPNAWMTVNTRDAAMADNVIWILNNLANGKVLVYSHNAHVKNVPTTGSVWDAFAQAPNAVGQYLRAVLGKELFIIGTSFAPSIKTAQPGSVDLALLAVDKPRFMVDLNSAAAANLQIKNWLAVKRPMEANQVSFLNLQLSSAFDALLFLGKSTSPR